MTIEHCTLTPPPSFRVAGGRYELRMARTASELDRILRLRYEVFNLELNEGLALSAVSGRDEDDFDRRFHHLLIEDLGSGAVVGTYRMQHRAMARSGGYYSAGLFDLDRLPAARLEEAVEIGRACVARAHRNGRVLHLLWKGLARYLDWSGASALFGCCSLTTQDRSLGLATHRYLAEQAMLHRELRVEPRPERRCEAEGAGPLPVRPRIPALFRSYLDVGARVLGPPAIDADFGTIDWLVWMDVRELDPAIRRRLAG